MICTSISLQGMICTTMSLFKITSQRKKVAVFSYLHVFLLSWPLCRRPDIV